MTTIEIDPNVRVRGNCTYAGFEDIVGEHQFAVGDDVEVVEPEADLAGQGRILEIDVVKELVYLAVDWSSLRPRSQSIAPVAATFKVFCSWQKAPERVQFTYGGVRRAHRLGRGTEHLDPRVELIAG